MHHESLPLAIALVVVACIVGVLWYLYKRLKKTSKKPKEPK